MRVLIIGLDGFTWTIGEKLIQDGYMPRLGELVRKGCHGNLKSVNPYETSPAWSSFQTGCLPGKTGVFAFHCFDRALRQIRLNSFQQISKASIWELLSRAGKQVVSINMPMTSPPPKVQGVIIPGLTCPGLSRDTVYPPDIFDRYIKSNLNYRIVDNTKKTDLNAYVDSAEKTEQTRCDVALKIMKDYQWDLFSVEIQSTDAFQHKNWWALDSQAEGFTQEAYLQAVEFYKSIDMIIGKLIDAADESVLKIIVSDHGFCAKKAEIGINTWLYQNGYLKLDLPDHSKKTGLKDRIKQHVPAVKALAQQYERLKGSFVLHKDRTTPMDQLYSEKVVSHIREIIDLDQTKAFCLGGMGGSLYLVNGDREDIGREIIQKLLTSYGPVSSNRLITSIQPLTEIYDLDVLPETYPNYLISFAHGVEARISPVEQEIVKSGIINGQQTGTHEPMGVYVLSGNNIRPDTELHAGIVDIVPTILACFSLAIPEYMDGQVVEGAFKEPPDIRFAQAQDIDKKVSKYSDTDQSIVEKQLEDLGYL